MIKKELWISFCVIAGSIVVASVGLYILSSSISSSVDDIIANRTSIQVQANELAAFATLKGDAVQAAPYEAAMEQLLPVEYHLIDFQNSVKALASTDGVTVKYDLQDNDTSPQGTMPGINPFTLEVSGSSAQIVKFLDDLQFNNQEFLLSYTSFDYIGQDQETGGTAATVQGNLFFR